VYNSLNEVGKKNFLGLEMAMWSEQVDNLSILQKIWIRGSAVAERAWSPYYINDIEKARARLMRHRCNVLAKRGVTASPIRADFCPYTDINI
jgi:hexosaminidase